MFWGVHAIGTAQGLALAMTTTRSKVPFTGEHL